MTAATTAKSTEIFRAGVHPASDGRIFVFSPAQLDEIAASYNPSRFRAPLIVSHDVGEYEDRDIANTELAFGVVEKVWRDGESLKASFNPISPEVSRWVADGRILDRSASFYPPDSANNPTPGKWSLRHVALLGKTPPAVKGMSPLDLSEVSFEDGSDAVSFGQGWDCSPYEMIADLFDGLRDVLIDARGLDVAESILPKDLITSLRKYQSMKTMDEDEYEDEYEDEDEDEDEDDGTMGSFGDLGEPESIHPLMQYFQQGLNYQEKRKQMSSSEERLRNQIDELRAQIQQEKRQRRLDQIANFQERHRERLTPAMLEPIALSFSEQPESFASFCEGLSDAQFEFMQKFVSRLPRQVDFGELTAGATAFPRSAKPTANFDAKSAEVDAKIKAYQRLHPELSYSEVALLPEFSELLSEIS